MFILRRISDQEQIKAWPTAPARADVPSSPPAVVFCPVAGQQIGDFEFAEVADPVAVPTVWDVAAERERRLALGFDYNFGDERGVHRIATTPQDMKNWDEVTKFASALIATGNPSETIGIVTETGPAVVTAMEWQDVLIAAGAFRQPYFQASFALQAMNPIPANYTDNSYWP